MYHKPDDGINPKKQKGSVYIAMPFWKLLFDCKKLECKPEIYEIGYLSKEKRVLSNEKDQIIGDRKIRIFQKMNLIGDNGNQIQSIEQKKLVLIVGIKQ